MGLPSVPIYIMEGNSAKEKTVITIVNYLQIISIVIISEMVNIQPFQKQKQVNFTTSQYVFNTQ